MAGNSNSGRPKSYEEFHKINAINKLWQKVERKIIENEEDVGDCAIGDYNGELVYRLSRRSKQINY